MEAFLKAILAEPGAAWAIVALAAMGSAGAIVRALWRRLRAVEEERDEALRLNSELVRAVLAAGRGLERGG